MAQMRPTAFSRPDGLCGANSNKCNTQQARTTAEPPAQHDMRRSNIACFFRGTRFGTCQFGWTRPRPSTLVPLCLHCVWDLKFAGRTQLNHLGPKQLSWTVIFAGGVFSMFRNEILKTRKDDGEKKYLSSPNKTNHFFLNLGPWFPMSISEGAVGPR